MRFIGSVFLVFAATVNALAQGQWEWWRDVEVVDALYQKVRELYPLELLDSTAFAEAHHQAQIKAKYAWGDLELEQVLEEFLAVLGDADARVVELHLGPHWIDDEESSLAKLRTAGSHVSYGRVTPRLGCICIEDWSGGDSVVTEVDSALSELRSTHGLVLDLRAWAAGSIEQGCRILGRFTSEPLAGLHLRKRVAGTDQHIDSTYGVVPRGEWQFEKPVVILADGAWPSEAIALAAAPLRHVRVIGDVHPIARGVEPVRVALTRTFTVQIPTAAVVHSDGRVLPGNRLVPPKRAIPRCGDMEDTELMRAIKRLEEMVVRERNQQQDRMEGIFQK